MILLDTNFLVEIARAFPETGLELEEWMEQGETIVTSSVAWGEFLSSSRGIPHLNLIRAVVDDQILPFGAAEAECAGRLSRETGRAHRWDTFIAATAIVAGANLATRNQRDFRRYVPLGLKLA